MLLLHKTLLTLKLHKFHSILSGTKTWVDKTLYQVTVKNIQDHVSYHFRGIFQCFSLLGPQTLHYFLASLIRLEFYDHKIWKCLHFWCYKTQLYKFKRDINSNGIYEILEESNCIGYYYSHNIFASQRKLREKKKFCKCFSHSCGCDLLIRCQWSKCPPNSSILLILYDRYSTNILH